MPAISAMNTTAAPNRSTGKENKASMACIPTSGSEPEIRFTDIELCLCFSFISCPKNFDFVGPRPGTWKKRRDGVRAVVAHQAGLMASIIRSVIQPAAIISKRKTKKQPTTPKVLLSVQLRMVRPCWLFIQKTFF